MNAATEHRGDNDYNNNNNNGNNDDESETVLRKKLNSNQNSAALSAKLSVLLMTKSKKHEEADDEDTVAAATASTISSRRLEAIDLAKRAIELAPSRPAGYSALSLASTSHEERMESLQQVTDLWTPECLMTREAFVGALVRLLVEPRKDEAKQMEGIIGRASLKHPSRRPLNQQETAMATRIEREVQQAINDITKSATLNDDNNNHNSQQQQQQQRREHLGALCYRMGTFYRKLDPPEENQPACRKFLQRVCDILPPSHESHKLAKFWIATLGDSDANVDAGLDRCPPEYIISLYSTFAAKFDYLLTNQLEYETPMQLRALLDELLLSRRQNGEQQQQQLLQEHPAWAERAIDLGCGTGLSGVAFANCCKELHGVDLSPEMIEKAKEKGCYTKLEVAGLVEYLASLNDDEPSYYDLIISCDVLVYLGNLQPLFEQVSKRIMPTSSSSNNGDGGGIFCFSTEYIAENDDLAPYVLQSTGRFAHKQSYIEKLTKDTGFEVMSMKVACIRKNGGQDIMGILCVLQKQR